MQVTATQEYQKNKQPDDRGKMEKKILPRQTPFPGARDD